MSYVPYSFAGFGAGLNLRDKADAVSEQEAIDALNVELSERGAVSQRAGYVAFTNSLTNDVGSLHPHYRAGATPHLLAGAGTRLEAIDSTGTVVASQSALTDGTWDFARFGTPNAEVSYAGQGNDLLQSWNGTAWASVASTPRAGALAVSATTNRLVAARFNTTNGGPDGSAGSSSPSHIYFSDLGDAESWGVDNFLQLTPGDGEQIQAVIAWREFVFAFKETKFFVFYGESEDAGIPVFDYTPIDTGVGLASPRAVAADERGVYFLDRKGVYVTRGGEPELLSDIIDPIFRGGSSDFYLGGELEQTQIENCAMATHDNRIYLGYTQSGSSVNDRTLVYDTERNWWSLYDFPTLCLTSFELSGTPELFFGADTGNLIHRHNPAQTNDDGTAITSRWRSGWHDFGDPTVKTSREQKVWGANGTVAVSIATDFDTGTGPTEVLDFADPSVDTWNGTTWNGGEWGVPSGLTPKLRRTSARGTTFSVLFENSTLNNTYSIHRFDHALREARIPSVTGATS